MNFKWIFEWWVKMQTNEWHYQHILYESDPRIIDVHLLLMLDNIRDGLWHRLNINEEMEGVMEEIYSKGDLDVYN